MNDTTQRDIGALQSDVRAIKDDLISVKDDVREVRDFMRGAQNNWKLLVTLATISAALGGMFSKLLSYLTGLSH